MTAAASTAAVTTFHRDGAMSGTSCTSNCLRQIEPGFCTGVAASNRKKAATGRPFSLEREEKLFVLSRFYTGHIPRCLMNGPLVTRPPWASRAGPRRFEKNEKPSRAVL